MQKYCTFHTVSIIAIFLLSFPTLKTHVRASPNRLILSVAAAPRFRLFLHDGSNEYLQGKKKLKRQIFMHPKEEALFTFWLEPEDLFELDKPLYRICEYYWGVA